MVPSNMLPLSEVNLWLSLVSAYDAHLVCALSQIPSRGQQPRIFLLLLALTTITTIAFLTGSHVQSLWQHVVLKTHNFCNCPEGCEWKADTAMSDRFTSLTSFMQVQLQSAMSCLQQEANHLQQQAHPPVAASRFIQSHRIQRKSISR